MSARLCSLGVKHTDKLQGNVCRWCSESFQRAGGKPCQPGESTLFIRYHPKAPKSSWLEALWGQWTVECSTICYAQLSISWLPGQCLPSSIFELWSCREGGLQQGRPVLHRDWKKIESVDRVNEHLLVFNHQTCLNTFTFFWVHATNILCRSFIRMISGHVNGREGVGLLLSSKVHFRGINGQRCVQSFTKAEFSL